MRTNLFTPDREINPPEHREPEQFECEECGGEGYYTERDEEDEEYIQVKCTKCCGLGFLEDDDELNGEF